jgi:hypothetical protein
MCYGIIIENHFYPTTAKILKKPVLFINPGLFHGMGNVSCMIPAGGKALFFVIPNQLK